MSLPRGGADHRHDRRAGHLLNKCRGARACGSRPVLGPKEAGKVRLPAAGSGM